MVNNTLSILEFPPNWLVETSDVSKGQYRHSIDNIYEPVEYLSFNKSMSKLFAHKELWEMYGEIGILAFISKSYLLNHHYVIKNKKLYINQVLVNNYSSFLNSLNVETAPEKKEKKKNKKQKKGKSAKYDYLSDTSSNKSISDDETTNEESTLNSSNRNDARSSNSVSNDKTDKNQDSSKPEQTSDIQLEDALQRLKNLSIEDLNKLPNCTIRKINNSFYLEFSIQTNLG